MGGGGPKRASGIVKKHLLTNSIFGGASAPEAAKDFLLDERDLVAI